MFYLKQRKQKVIIFFLSIFISWPPICSAYQLTIKDFFDAITTSDLPTIDAYLENNQDNTPLQNYLNVYSKNLLQLAISQKDVEVVRRLLAYQPLAKWQPTGGYRGREPIMLAITHNAPDIVTELLEAGANIHHTKRFQKQTLLHLAARYGQLENAKLLVKHGARLDALAPVQTYYHGAPLDRHELTPLEMAGAYDQVDTFRYLLQLETDNITLDTMSYLFDSLHLIYKIIQLRKKKDIGPFLKPFIQLKEKEKYIFLHLFKLCQTLYPNNGFTFKKMIKTFKESQQALTIPEQLEKLSDHNNPLSLALTHEEQTPATDTVIQKINDVFSEKRPAMVIPALTILLKHLYTQNPEDWQQWWHTPIDTNNKGLLAKIKSMFTASYSPKTKTVLLSPQQYLAQLHDKNRLSSQQKAICENYLHDLHDFLRNEID